MYPSLTGARLTVSHTSSSHPGHLVIEHAWREFLHWHRCSTWPRVLHFIGGIDGDIDVGDLLSDADTWSDGEEAPRRGLRVGVFFPVGDHHRVRVAVHAIRNSFLGIVRDRE